MHKYFIKTPWLVKQVFPSYTWDLPNDDNAIYLTFDDGPCPVITPWVLDELNKHDIKATFFCIGRNVESNPEIYQRIIDEGHATGNHSYSHLNGWKTPRKKYMEDISKAATLIDSNLFRPPYGRIKQKQARDIPDALKKNKTRIIMWDVLSADFDADFSPEQCLSNVIDNVSSGSIIVYHDSEKAFRNLEYALPRSIKELMSRGFSFRRIE